MLPISPAFKIGDIGKSYSDDRQSNAIKPIRKSYAYRTIQYLLGHVNSNFITNYFKADQSIADKHTQDTHVSNQEAPAQSLLFGTTFADTLRDSTVFDMNKRDRKMSEASTRMLQSQFTQAKQVVNEYEIKSTLSSEDENAEQDIAEKEYKFQLLESMLSTQARGIITHGRQRVVVESVFKGLLGEQSCVFQIPCLMSSDHTTFYVLLDQMDSKKFSKTALFNLVDTAEAASNDAKRIVFFVSKDDVTRFGQMESLFSVIDAHAMKIEDMEGDINKNELLRVQSQFGLFELAL